MDYAKLIKQTLDLVHSYNSVVSTVDGHVYDQLGIKDGDVFFILQYLRMLKKKNYLFNKFSMD